MIKFQVVIESWEDYYACEGPSASEEDCGPVFATLAEAGAHLEVLMRSPRENIVDEDGLKIVTYGEYLIRVIDEDRRKRLRAEKERERALDEAYYARQEEAAEAAEEERQKLAATSPFGALASLKFP